MIEGALVPINRNVLNLQKSVSQTQMAGFLKSSNVRYRPAFQFRVPSQTPNQYKQITGIGKRGSRKSRLNGVGSRQAFDSFCVFTGLQCLASCEVGRPTEETEYTETHCKKLTTTVCRIQNQSAAQLQTVSASVSAPADIQSKHLSPYGDLFSADD